MFHDRGTSGHVEDSPTNRGKPCRRVGFWPIHWVVGWVRERGNVCENPADSSLVAGLRRIAVPAAVALTNYAGTAPSPGPREPSRSCWPVTPAPVRLGERAATVGVLLATRITRCPASRRVAGRPLGPLLQHQTGPTPPSGTCHPLSPNPFTARPRPRPPSRRSRNRPTQRRIQDGSSG